MNNIERAIATSQSLGEVLAEEVARAQEQRELIRNFNSAGLLDRAVLRERFNSIVKELQSELTCHLQAVAAEYGLSVMSVEALAQVADEPATRLAASLAKVRALAGSLHELDNLNRQLAQRANSMVRGYLGALTGGAATYNQRGETRPYTASTYSGKA